MSRRKPWNELSPAYRARLTRKGITATSHAAGADISTGRGHGPNTPSSRRRALERRARRPSLKAAEIIRRERQLRYVPASAIADALDDLGPDRMSMVLEWQEWRTGLWVRGGDSKGWTTPELLPQYIESRYGEDAWDDEFQSWYDSDIAAIFNPYHPTQQ